MNVKNLCFKHCKNGPLFFRDLTFSLEPGKLHALHGKNGIGKSVLLNVLSGNKPMLGEVSGEIAGKEQACLVHQRFDQMIADQFSFQENVGFACMKRYPSFFRRMPEPEISTFFLEQFQIDVNKPACQLSGGQRQILALFMAVQQSKTILLLDEPTAALDERNAESVFKYLRLLAEEGMTLFIVCHDKQLVDLYTTGRSFLLELGTNGERGISEFPSPSSFR